MTIPVTLFRSACQRCGNITVTPPLTEVSVRIYSRPDGSDAFLVLCPECKAKWERMLSYFLDSGSEQRNVNAHG